MLFNKKCKSKDLPFGKECGKNWNVVKYGYFAIDSSVSLECKSEGTIHYIRL